MQAEAEWLANLAPAQGFASARHDTLSSATVRYDNNAGDREVQLAIVRTYKR